LPTTRHQSQQPSPRAPRHQQKNRTQVAFLRDGSFLVSDGYCNARVMRFKADGGYHSEYSLSVARSKGGVVFGGMEWLGWGGGVGG